MKLTFLGTRGNIEPESEHHRMHSSLLVSYYRRRVMIDCGETWRGRLGEISPQAIVVTHAHPDHAWGLRDGAPCPVWATAEAREEFDSYPLAEYRTVRPRRPFEPVGGIVFEAFPVDHSTRAPAVGYRIGAGRVRIFYVPDVVYIPAHREALEGCRLYVGDGATIDRNMVRRPGGGALVGHTTVRAQLTWCAEEGVSKMIVTHCGSQIVRGEIEQPEATRRKLQEYAHERGVEVEVAHDGLEIVLR